MTRGRLLDTLTDAEAAELLAAGWAPTYPGSPWWIDPVSREPRYCTTALRVCRRDRERDRGAA